MSSILLCALVASAYARVRGGLPPLMRVKHNTVSVLSNGEIEEPHTPDHASTGHRSSIMGVEPPVKTNGDMEVSSHVDKPLMRRKASVSHAPVHAINLKASSHINLPGTPESTTFREATAALQGSVLDFTVDAGVQVKSLLSRHSSLTIVAVVLTALMLGFAGYLTAAVYHEGRNASTTSTITGCLEGAPGAITGYLEASSTSIQDFLYRCESEKSEKMARIPLRRNRLSDDGGSDGFEDEDTEESDRPWDPWGAEGSDRMLIKSGLLWKLRRRHTLLLLGRSGSLSLESADRFAFQENWDYRLFNLDTGKDLILGYISDLDNRDGNAFIIKTIDSAVLQIPLRAGEDQEEQVNSNLTKYITKLRDGGIDVDADETLPEMMHVFTVSGMWREEEKSTRSKSKGLKFDTYESTPVAAGRPEMISLCLGSASPEDCTEWHTQIWKRLRAMRRKSEESERSLSKPVRPG